MAREVDVIEPTETREEKGHVMTCLAGNFPRKAWAKPFQLGILGCDRRGNGWLRRTDH